MNACRQCYVSHLPFFWVNEREDVVVVLFWGASKRQLDSFRRYCSEHWSAIL